MSTTIKTTMKPGKKSRIVSLRISPTRLTQWPSDSVSVGQASAVPSIKKEASPSVQLPELADKSSDSNATPVPAGTDAADPNSLAPPKADGRRKRGGATATGRKRAPPSIDPNAPPRERGRPGPKKKPRLPDGTIDRTTENVNGARPVNAIPAHKLGPKANTGAINAGLRALDRTGKPCRRWGKKTLEIKSFTGAAWQLSSWKAPPKDQGFPGDVKSDSASSSDMKLNQSSAVQSDRSHSHVGEDTMMTGMQSSPAPMPA
ncbi:Putative INO80 complex, subunit Ies4 protein [Septoria linicola]|uniref:INO80 complex, subunit Ies4 protein n=1 Tax=Septoria linicola TaxID=215465 RepID=A0A9Q9AJX4_9PEZI|nr:putative INO80 complex, subunit Ies4 protein [Septoria linicola]USW49269.1 Putative INO80 complex, subunit Ies4 protein [Septoria linicola]